MPRLMPMLKRRIEVMLMLRLRNESMDTLSLHKRGVQPSIWLANKNYYVMPLFLLFIVMLMIMLKFMFMFMFILRLFQQCWLILKVFVQIIKKVELAKMNLRKTSQEMGIISFRKIKCVILLSACQRKAFLNCLVGHACLFM